MNGMENLNEWKNESEVFSVYVNKYPQQKKNGIVISNNIEVEL